MSQQDAQLRQQLDRLGIKVAPWRLPAAARLGREGLAEGEDEEEVDEPQVRRVRARVRVGVEVVERLHEGLLVEEVEHLAAVELDGVDEVDGVVLGREGRHLRPVADPVTVPVESIGRAIKDEGARRQRRLVDVLMGDVEDATGEGPVRRRPEVDWTVLGLSGFHAEGRLRSDLHILPVGAVINSDWPVERGFVSVEATGSIGCFGRD